MRYALDLTIEEWKHYLSEKQEKTFLAASIFRWIHGRRVMDFNAMSDLPLKLREKLREDFYLALPAVAAEQVSPDGTRKYLLSLGNASLPDRSVTDVECVLMKYRFGYSLCISSQAGCRMGCRFCASTLNGLERNLTGGEMAAQIYAVEQAAQLTVSHVVVMGCGEPFDNWDELMRYLSVIHSEEGKNLSYRNITVSTCGLPEKIRSFADTDLPVTLAISLHAPNDLIRRKIMRIAMAVDMDTLMDACRYYISRTNRRITFEYLLIDHLNDSKREAEELAERLKGLLCHVNVIPVNPVEECGFSRPSEARIADFVKTLENRHVPVTRRREMGGSIDAACGQLRHKQSQQRTER